MKRYYTLLLSTLFLSSMSACKKDVNTATHDVMYNMIMNKTWYLDYSITGANTKAFVGQSTYFITYLKDGTTKDSDGLTGTYTLVNNNGQYQIKVSAKTVNGNTLNYTHNIETIGETTMIQSYMASGQTTKTNLYFTSK